MAETINIATFNLDTQLLQKNLNDLQDAFFDLRKTQKEYSDQSKETTKEINLLAKEQKVLASASGDNSKAISENDAKMKTLLTTQRELFKSEQNLGTQMGTVKKEINQTTTQLRSYQDAEGKTTALIDLGNSALGRSIKNKNDARAANIALNNVANQLNPNIKKEAELLVQLNTQMDKNTKFIKENSSETAKQKMNVGNYEGALRSVFPQLSGVIEQVKNVRDGLIDQGTVMKASIITTGGLSGALKILKIALISIGIGAIVVVLGSLIGFLLTTQKGIDAVTSVTRPLQTIFQSLIGVMQTIGATMFNAFSKPKVLLQDLMKFLEGQVVNRLKSFKVIMDGILEGDTKKITNGLFQLTTGVTNMTDKVAKAAQVSGKFLGDAAKKGAEIDRLQKSIEKSTLKYDAAQEGIKDKLEEQLLISKDTSRTFAEREKAANAMIKIAGDNSIQEQDIIKLQIKKLAIQQSLNDKGREGQAEMTVLTNKLKVAEDRAQDVRLENMRILGGAKKEDLALSKEISDKAIENSLTQSKAEIDLFITNQGFKKKSLQEEYDFNNALLKKESADLKLQLDKKKISQTEYDTQLKTLQNNKLASDAELMIENANLELDAQISKNQKILENDQYLSDEQLRIKQEALTAQLLAETNYQALLLEKGKINQSEYDAAIAIIKAESKVKADELIAINKAAEQEKALIDLENKAITDDADFIAQAEIDKARNAIKLAQEIEAAEKNGADIQLIKDKYAQMDKDIDSAVMANKLNVASQTFGNLATIFGENSKAGKAMAIAQTTIDTYQSAISAYKSYSGLGPWGVAAGIVAAAAATASGFAAVKKITATKEPTFKRASYATGVIGLRGSGSGTSDSISANLSAGESVINARSTSMFARELGAINQSGGGVGLNGSSNILSQNEIQSNVNNSQMAAMIAEAVAIGSELGTSKGSQKGIIGLSENRKIMSDAKF